jgi:hypothetical protein
VTCIAGVMEGTSYKNSVFKCEGNISFERGMLTLENDIKMELKIGCVALI